jgi:alpha-galactosidase
LTGAIFQAVQFFESEEEKCWILTTDRTAYVLGIAANGRLQHRYWGERLPYPSDYPGRGKFEASYAVDGWMLPSDEYPGWGGFLYTEPCLKVTFADGVRDVVLVYSHQRQETSPEGLPVLVITLKDTYYPFEVDLHYKVVSQCDLIQRWATIRNTGQTWLDLEAALSAAWQLPTLRDGSYRLTHLSGRWSSETQVRHTVLTDGRKTLESRRGLTSAGANPFFAIDILSPDETRASEEAGQVWFGALGWSGNWKIAIDHVSDPVRAYVAGGINDFDFRWRLKPGEAFVTPPFIGGYTTKGFGQASRNLHLYQLDYLLPRTHAKQLRQVLYNSWEAVSFDVTEEKQLQLAERAAQLGVELFVIDDGWFGQRHHDRAGLGDWYVNSEKFPRGLDPLIARVHELGMNFGIWVEPEMVNPDSDLYRAHPDWVYNFPHRSRSELRNQLLLNLARPEVAAHISTWLDNFLSQHHIDFIKWDFNRPISEPGWPDAPLEHHREVYVRHVQVFYDIVEWLRTRHPTVVWEVCAGGGGRADLGTLARFDQCWVSDNTDPFDRLKIQEGYSMAYAPKTMMAWVSNSPTSQHINNEALHLRYRFHSAMTGSLGLGEDLSRYTEEQMTEATALVAEYKTLRHIVQEGLLYRLISPRTSDLASVQYVSRDRRESVVFVFLHAQHYWHVAPRVYPRGLDPARHYYIEGSVGAATPVSGQSLMSLGLQPHLEGHFGSALIKLKMVDEKE